MTAPRAELALRKPDLATDRPTTPAPIYHQIPAEMQARRQWVVWRYGLDKNGKWTKIPYNPTSGKPAGSNRPSSWGTFQEAKAAYLENPIANAGIGYVFRKDDPFVGVDLDHCRNPETGEITSWARAWLDRFATYAEISPSQTGVKMIVRGTFPGAKGIKKPLGEMYAWGRFFTITGAALAGHTTIADSQAAIDALYIELRGAAGDSKPARDGSAGAGDRAALAASHPESEWIEARRLRRAEGDLLLKRSHLATQKEETQGGKVNQGYYAARLLWAELHRRCPGIGLYRANGELDDSQCRAVMSLTLYGRGFTFPQFVVIMSYHFAAYCLAKWGTKQAWREELATLWQYAIEHTSYTPRGAVLKPAVAKRKKPKGRASNHAAHVEQIYQLLQEQRAGDKAIVKTADLASETGMHRVTVAGILAELRSAGRIATERFSRYGGLVVSFLDVAIVAEQAADLPIAAPEIAPTIEPQEETRVLSCVSSETAPAGYNSDEQPEPLTLRQLAAEYLDTPAKAIVNVNKKTGAINARHTAYHFADMLAPQYSQAECIAAYKAEQDYRAELVRQEWQRFFAQLRAMGRDDLVAYIGGRCRAEVATLCEDVSTFDRHLYRTRLKCAKEQLQRRGWTMPAKATKAQAQADQARRDTEQVITAKRKAARPVACQPIRYEQPTPPAAAGPAPNVSRLLAWAYNRKGLHSDAQRVLGGAQ